MWSYLPTLHNTLAAMFCTICHFFVRYFGKLIKFRTQSDACTTLPLMSIYVLVHFASCCGVPIRMYSVLESFIFSFMLCIQLLISLMHRSIFTILRIRVRTTVYLMVTNVGMPRFPVLINDIENGARVLREFNRT